MLRLLGKLLRPLPARRPKRTLELNVTEQLILFLLFRFESADITTIDAEVTQRRPLLRAEVPASLVRLQATGMIERIAADDKVRRLYRATKEARRLQRLIRSEPKSVVEFWL